jgi:hypothetical protein
LIHVFCRRPFFAARYLFGFDAIGVVLVLFGLDIAATLVKDGSDGIRYRTRWQYRRIQRTCAAVRVGRCRLEELVKELDAERMELRIYLTIEQNYLSIQLRLGSAVLDAIKDSHGRLCKRATATVTALLCNESLWCRTEETGMAHPKHEPSLSREVSKTRTRNDDD